MTRKTSERDLSWRLVRRWAILAPTGASQVPLPTPAPLAKERGAPPQTARQGQPAAPAEAPSFNPLSGIKSLFNLDKPSDKFDAKQRDQVVRVSQYLSSVHQLSARPINW